MVTAVILTDYAPSSYFLIPSNQIFLHKLFYQDAQWFNHCHSNRNHYLHHPLPLFASTFPCIRALSRELRLCMMYLKKDNFNLAICVSSGLIYPMIYLFLDCLLYSLLQLLYTSVIFKIALKTLLIHCHEIKCQGLINVLFTR